MTAIVETGPRGRLRINGCEPFIVISDCEEVQTCSGVRVIRSEDARPRRQGRKNNNQQYTNPTNDSLSIHKRWDTYESLCTYVHGVQHQSNPKGEPPYYLSTHLSTSFPSSRTPPPDTPREVPPSRLPSPSQSSTHPAPDPSNTLASNTKRQQNLFHFFALRPERCGANALIT